MFIFVPTYALLHKAPPVTPAFQHKSAGVHLIAHKVSCIVISHCPPRREELCTRVGTKC